MLVSLFAALTLLAQAPFPTSPAKPARKVSIPFTVYIPPIPFFQPDTLHYQPSRKLIPLTTALLLDDPAEEAREEQDLIAAINNERAARGLSLLVSDRTLSEAARAHCREMCTLNYFAHHSPTPGEATPVDRYLDELHADGERQPADALVGENIFFASVTNGLYNVNYAHRSLMASPGHRHNILEPRFTKVGVGLYRDPQGQFWVTEMFLRDT